MTKPDLLARVRNAHAITARLVLNDPRYIPLFESFEADLKRLKGVDDPIARARAAAQNAKADRIS